MNGTRYPVDTPLHSAPPQGGIAQVLARALGWFSLILGVTGLLAPGRGERAGGVRSRRAAVRGFGAREAATGAGLLLSRNPEPWVWARVAGDLADIAVLASAPGRRGGFFGRRGADLRTSALAALAAVTAVDLACAEALRRERRTRDARRHDWSGRSGFPRPASEMRGAARDFETPVDMRTPAALAPRV